LKWRISVYFSYLQFTRFNSYTVIAMPIYAQRSEGVYDMIQEKRREKRKGEGGSDKVK
jgi:hypothetical protein